MKAQIKFIPLLITLGVALLSGYGFYAANANDGDFGCWIMLGVSAFAFFVVLAGGFAVKYKEGGSAVGIVALSVVAFAILLAINLIATFAVFHAAPYIISSGITLLAYVGIAYALSKAL